MKAKFILKISLKNIKSHLWREIIVLVFLAASLALFCMSIAASAFSDSDAVVECLYKYEDVYTVYSNDGSDITEEEEELLAEVGGAYAKMTYSGEFSMKYIDYFLTPVGNDDDGEENDGDDSLPTSEYVTAINEAFISDMGWSLSGRLPSAECEIAISGCLFDKFLSDSYYDYINYPWTITEEREVLYDERGIYSFSSVEEFLALSPVVWIVNSDGVSKTEMTIVGVVNCGECPVHTGQATSRDKFVEIYDGLFVSDEYFDSFNMQLYMAFAGKETEEECRSFVMAVETDGGFSFWSPTIEKLSEKSAVLEQLKTTFFLIAVALVVFSAALTYWVISFSIEKRKGDVGILRANGAKKSDVALIFFFESLITALAQAALAIFAAAIAIPAINSTLAKYISVPITFIRLTPFSAVCAVIISVLLNALATVIPVAKTANKLPIDSIKNYIE